MKSVVKNEVVKIGIQFYPNPDHVTFYMREETRNHLPLGRRLMKLQGIKEEIEGYPLCMDHKGNYDFGLSKGLMFTWEEMLPEIKKVIQTYFKSKGNEVEFVDVKRLS